MPSAAVILRFIGPTGQLAPKYPSGVAPLLSKYAENTTFLAVIMLLPVSVTVPAHWFTSSALAWGGVATTRKAKANPRIGSSRASFFRAFLIIFLFS